PVEQTPGDPAFSKPMKDDLPGASAPSQTVQPLTIDVEGMHCASCVGRVERALKGVPGVTEASVNLATQKAQVYFDRVPDLRAAIEAVGKAGYEARPARSDTAAQDELAERQRAESAELRRPLIVACVLTLPVLLLQL